jgi:hypothetical protein
VEGGIWSRNSPRDDLAGTWLTMEWLCNCCGNLSAAPPRVRVSVIAIRPGLFLSTEYTDKESPTNRGEHRGRKLNVLGYHATLLDCETGYCR